MTEIVKAAGRTLADFKQLSPAEQKLLAACRLGEFAKIAEVRPEAATDNNTVRAAFLRFLALDGDKQAPVHEHGVKLKGAWVEGVLDLEGAHVPSSLTLHCCHFSDEPQLLHSHIYGLLSLAGSHVNGLKADGMICDGGVFLRDGFTALGQVCLLGAQIGGALSFRRAKLDGKDGDALVCDEAVIKGSVLLRDGFSANGQVRLLGAQVNGNLDCSGAKLDAKVIDGNEGNALSCDGAVIKGNVFLRDHLAADGSKNSFTANGKIRLHAVQISGVLECTGAKLDCKEGNALSCDGANVAGIFFFRDLVSPVNGVSLASMQVRALADDGQAWGERLDLHGFVYEELLGDAPIDAVARLAWLNKQSKPHAGLNGDGANFKPQPWQQLIRVLRHMGHAEDARQVGIVFEHRLRRANLIGQAAQHWYRPDAWIYRHACRTAHRLYWLFTGYGYRPFRLVMWMLGVWLICAGIYWYAALDGVFAPSNPLVFQNPKYQMCTAECAGNWYLCESLPQEYTGFSPLAYSLDVILPLVDLQQETGWAPLISTPKNIWYEEWLVFDLKHGARLLVWSEILFGWVASLLLVAVVSGLTKRREE